MSRHFSFLGLPNFLGAGSSSVSTGAAAREVATLPASKLVSEEPSEVARVSSVVPDWAAWRLFAPAYAAYLPDAVVLVNSNISPWGMYRFSCFSHHVAPFYASSVVDSNNMTGTVSDVAEDVNDNDDFSTTNEPTLPGLAGWWVRYGGFGISDDQVSSTYNDQYSGAVIARVGYAIAMGGDPLDAQSPILPSVWCRIYENGTLRQDLGKRAVSITAASGGQVLIWRFDPRLVAVGANLEVRFDFTSQSGHYASLDCFSVTVADSASPAVGESGWLFPPNAFSSQAFVDSNYPAPQVHLPYRAVTGTVFPSTTMNVWISDDQTDHDPTSYDYRAITVPSGFLQAGHAILGQAIYLEFGVTIGNPFVMRVITVQQGGNTVSGQSYVVDSYRQRSGDASLVLRQAENSRLMDAIDFRRGYTGAFFVAADPDAPVTTQVFNSAYVTLDPNGGAGDAQFSSDGGYDDEGLAGIVYKTYKFIEKL